jgi:O-antigen/teichoic acid export membrane protein
MLNAPHLAFALVLGAGFLLFSTINGYQTGALSGLEAYASLAKAGVVSGIAAIVAISLGAWWGGLNGALIGLSMSAIFRCGIHYEFLRIESRVHGIKQQFREGLLQEKTVILNFALPAALAGFFLTPMIWLANTFLVRQQDGYAEMALYAAAANFRIAVLFLPNVINNVGMSILNNEKARGDLRRYHQLFRNNVLHIFLISLGGAFVVGILGRPLLELFGKDFGAGYPILWLLLAASIFDAMSLAMYQYMQSQAKIWHALIGITIPTGLFLVAAAYFFVQIYGGVGLAIATMATSILGLICHMTLVVLLRRRVGIEINAHSGRDIEARG